MEMEKICKILVLITLLFVFFLPAYAQNTADVAVIADTQQQPKLVLAEPVITPSVNYEDPLRYVLGSDDVIQIDVMRHPEFSGVYPVNLEGKIQYKFVGDIEVARLNKKGLEEKLRNIIANFVISPEVNVTVLEYKSKVIYILGEVGQPGKYYMRSETIPVREALMLAGLPLQSAAMRKCRIISPDESGRVRTKKVDVYSVLYGGDLRYNYEMRPGDVLYVPCTVMAKLIRIINPVTSTVSGAAAGPTGAASGKSAVTTLAK